MNIYPLTPRSTLHAPRSSLHTPHSTLHTPPSTLHTPPFTLHTPHSTEGATKKGTAIAIPISSLFPLPWGGVRGGVSLLHPRSSLLPFLGEVGRGLSLITPNATARRIFEIVEVAIFRPSATPFGINLVTRGAGGEAAVHYRTFKVELTYAHSGFCVLNFLHFLLSFSC